MSPHDPTAVVTGTGPEPAATSRHPRLLRRIIAVGDLHGDLRAARSLLAHAGLLEGDAWRGGNAILVQLGDVVDRGPHSVETYEFLASLQARARRGRGEVVRLLGNHEVALIEGDYSMTDFAEAPALAERIRADVLAGRAHAAYAHGGWLFTHAGAGFALLQRLRGEMRDEGRFTLRRLADLLDRKLRAAVESGDYSDPIFTAGEARGGEHATGGIFWADYDEELHAPARAPRFHQVFGHTPEGYRGARFRKASDGRRINIDIGISSGYGGNLGWLEIHDREAIAHYLNEDGAVEMESLGTAPRTQAAPRVPSPPPSTESPA